MSEQPGDLKNYDRKCDDMRESLAELFIIWLEHPDKVTAAQANVVRQFLKEHGQIVTTKRRSAIHVLSEKLKAQKHPFPVEGKASG